MRIYIMGPMTGLPDYNKPAFFTMAEIITEVGYEPVHTADMPLGLEYDEYINESLKRLSTCDSYVLLPGWEDSNGVCNYELPFAKNKGIEQFFDQDELFRLVEEKGILSNGLPRNDE